MAGNITGFVFRDRNHNLVRDPGEGIADVTVHVGTHSTTTNARGTFSIPNVAFAMQDLIIEYGDVRVAARVQISDGDAVISLINDSLLRSSATTELGSGIQRAELTGSADVNLFPQSGGPILWHRLTGNDGDNAIWGYYGNDTLFGGDGNDSLYGGYDNDRLFGGAGDDVLYGEGDNDTLSGGAGDDQIDGGGDDDLLNGEDGNDLLDGGLGLNTLHGGNGNDTLEAHGGGGRLFGDHGDDLLHADAAYVVNGGTGRDTAVYEFSTIDYYIDLRQTTEQSTGAGRQILTGIENVSVAGGNDTIIGNSAGNLLVGGNDHNNQGYWGDSLDGGAGNDTLRGEGGYDMLIGGSGNDVIDGGAHEDTLIGGRGNDTIDGGADTDLAQFIVNRTVSVNLAAGTVTSAVLGSDTIRNVENIETGSGADSLIGDDGGNLFRSGGGNDTLNGGGGNDTLVGGAGRDLLIGGAGNDQFIFEAGGGIDTVRDFTHQGFLKTNDVLVFTADLASGAQDGDDVIRMYAHATEDNKSTEFVFDDGTTVLLQNIALDTLDAGSVLVI